MNALALNPSRKNRRTLKGNLKNRFRTWAIEQNLCDDEEGADLISFGLEVGFKIGIGVSLLVGGILVAAHIVLTALNAPV